MQMQYATAQMPAVTMQMPVQQMAPMPMPMPMPMPYPMPLPASIPPPVQTDQTDMYDVGPDLGASEIPARHRVTFARICRSEWVKLFTLSSTWWVLGITVAATFGLGAIIMSSKRLQILDTTSGTAYASGAAADLGQILQLILGVLAVLFITNEYSSGQIRSSLTAVPKRWPVLVAKTVIISVVGFITSFVAYYGAILVGWLMVKGTKLPLGWKLIDDRFTGATAKTIALMSLSTVFVLIFALAAGALLRNTAAGISTLVGVLFLLPVLLNALQWDWVLTAQHYLLSFAQIGIYSTASPPLSFVTSLWVSAVWAFAPLVVALFLLQARDA